MLNPKYKKTVITSMTIKIISRELIIYKNKAQEVDLCPLLMTFKSFLIMKRMQYTRRFPHNLRLAKDSSRKTDLKKRLAF